MFESRADNGLMEIYLVLTESIGPVLGVNGLSEECKWRYSSSAEMTRS